MVPPPVERAVLSTAKPAINVAMQTTVLEMLLQLPLVDRLTMAHATGRAPKKAGGRDSLQLQHDTSRQRVAVCHSGTVTSNWRGAGVHSLSLRSTQLIIPCPQVSGCLWGAGGAVIIIMIIGPPQNVWNRGPILARDL